MGSEMCIRDRIRKGEWKYLELKKGNKKKGNQQTEYYLFNLAEDIGEQNNVVKESVALVEELRTRMVEADKEITENGRPVFRVEMTPKESR